MQAMMQVEKPKVADIRSANQVFSLVTQQQSAANVLNDLDEPNEVGIEVELRLEEHALLYLVNRQGARLL